MTDSKIPALKYLIRLAFQEIIESKETPQALLDKLAADYSEFKPTIQEVWKIRGAIARDSKTTRYDSNTDNVALRKALEKLTQQWMNRAHPITFIDAVTRALQQKTEFKGRALAPEVKAQLIKDWEQKVNPLNQVFTIDQLKNLDLRD